MVSNPLYLKALLLFDFFFLFKRECSGRWQLKCTSQARSVHVQCNHRSQRVHFQCSHRSQTSRSYDARPVQSVCSASASPVRASDHWFEYADHLYHIRSALFMQS